MSLRLLRSFSNPFSCRKNGTSLRISYDDVNLLKYTLMATDGLKRPALGVPVSQYFKSPRIDLSVRSFSGKNCFPPYLNPGVAARLHLDAQATIQLLLLELLIYHERPFSSPSFGPLLFRSLLLKPYRKNIRRPSFPHLRAWQQ